MSTHDIYMSLYTMSMGLDCEMSHEGDEPMVTIAIIATWLVTDAFVLIGEFYADAEDVSVLESLTENAKFLTNQVWAFGIVAKFSFLFATWCVWEQSPIPQRDVRRFEVQSLLFLVYGIMLNAVLMTFFLLIYSTKTLLDAALEDEKFTLSQIILWNHVRHVTPVVLHIVVLLLSRFQLRGSLGAIAPRVVFFVTSAVSISAGLIHSQLFDDKLLYKYGSTTVGQKCQLIFVITSLLTASGFVFVLLRLGTTPPPPAKPVTLARVAPFQCTLRCNPTCSSI